MLVEASVTYRSTSDRLSFSSAPYGEALTQTESSYPSTPTVKIEDQSDNIIEGEEIGTSIADMSYRRLVDSANSYAYRLESEFSPDQATLSLSKVRYPASLDSHSVSALPALSFNKRSERQEKSPAKSRNHNTASSLVVQTGQSHRFTTEEDANFHCQMQGNKLFHNAHNFETDMRSHVVNQKNPFLCSIKDCSRRFTRKTDLKRHYKCVHVRQRNYHCYFCDQAFARKDTMRR